jgi:hypothetical protein
MASNSTIHPLLLLSILLCLAVTTASNHEGSISNIVVLDADRFDRRTMTGDQVVEAINLQYTYKSTLTHNRRLKGKSKSNNTGKSNSNSKNNSNSKGTGKTGSTATATATATATSKSKESIRGITKKSPKSEQMHHVRISQEQVYQRVLLDFNTSETFDIKVDGVVLTLPAYTFEQNERNEIQHRLERIFAGYSILFTQSRPATGDYSAITFECQTEKYIHSSNSNSNNNNSSNNSKNSMDKEVVIVHLLRVV